MKIILINKYRKVMVQSEGDDLDIYEVLDLVHDALVGLSFASETVQEGIIGQAEQYKEDKGDKE